MALRYPSICQRLLCRRNLYCIANFRGFLVQILGRKISSQDSAASTMDWCKLYCSLLQTKLQGFLYVHNYTENVNDSSAKLQMFFATAQFCKENILSIWRCFTPTMVYGARVNYNCRSCFRPNCMVRTTKASSATYWRPYLSIACLCQSGQKEGFLNSSIPVQNFVQEKSLEIRESWDLGNMHRPLSASQQSNATLSW